MAPFDDPRIPEEIRRAEQVPAARPVRAAGPTVLGLPGLPPDLLDLLVRYTPILALAAAVLGGSSALGALLLAQNATVAAVAPLPVSAFLGLAAAVGLGVAYIWLSQRRRLGWNVLAAALIVQFLGQFLASGVSSILYAGIEVLATVYLMLQIRESYSS